MIDEDLFRRMFLQLLRMHVDLHTTMTAMGLVLQDADQTFEAKVGEKRATLLPRAEKVLQMFEQANTADWLQMLRNLQGPTH